jgi:hypothetical protein
VSIENDEDGLAELERAGLPIGEHRWLTHFFSFPLNRDGAMAAWAELERCGWPEVVIDEEVEGDDYWHIAAFGRLAVTAESIAATRRDLKQLAERHGGVYDGWDLTWRLPGRPLPNDRPEIRSPGRPGDLKAL